MSLSLDSFTFTTTSASWNEIGLRILHGVEIVSNYKFRGFSFKIKLHEASYYVESQVSRPPGGEIGSTTTL